MTNVASLYAVCIRDTVIIPLVPSVGRVCRDVVRPDVYRTDDAKPKIFQAPLRLADPVGRFGDGVVGVTGA